MNNSDIEKLYNKYHKYLVGLAITRTKNKADAEDIVQDVFAEALQSTAFHSIEEDDHAKNWLEQAVIHTAIDAKRKRHGEVNLGDQAGNIEEGANAILDMDENERLSALGRGYNPYGSLEELENLIEYQKNR